MNKLLTWCPLLFTAFSAPALAAEIAPVELRFCPAQTARTYPLDTTRRVEAVLLQNAIIVNRSAGTVTIDKLSIVLERKGAEIDGRNFEGETLGAVAKGGQALAQSGMMDVFAFQFCDGALLKDAKLSTDLVLEPNEALLLMHQPFVWRGVRDRISLKATFTASGGRQDVTASLPLTGGGTKTSFVWPLRGGPWIVGSGASFHTAHRWAVPEEFALDIARAGPDGRTYRKAGGSHANFYAYGAEVLAAADGEVVEVISGISEDPPLVRATDESMDAYMGRVMQAQSVRIAGGPNAIVGNSIIIDHGNSEYSVYAHLRPGSITVAKGTRVTAGQPIARLGSSGNSTEPHLHFQVCDRPSALSCAALQPTFDKIELPQADGPRPIQSGDVVISRGF